MSDRPTSLFFYCYYNICSIKIHFMRLESETAMIFFKSSCPFLLIWIKESNANRKKQKSNNNSVVYCGNNTSGVFTNVMLFILFGFFPSSILALFALLEHNAPPTRRNKKRVSLCFFLHRSRGVCSVAAFFFIVFGICIAVLCYFFCLTSISVVSQWSASQRIYRSVQQQQNKELHKPRWRE